MGSVTLCAYYLCRVHPKNNPQRDAHLSSSASARRGSNSHAVRMCCCHCAADAPAPLLLAEPGAPSSGAAHTWQAVYEVCSWLGQAYAGWSCSSRHLPNPNGISWRRLSKCISRTLRPAMWPVLILH